MTLRTELRQVLAPHAERRIEAWALTPLDDLLSNLRSLAFYVDLEVRAPELPPGLEPPGPPPDPLAEVASALEGDPDPWATTALELLPFVDEAGFLRPDDEALAHALGLPAGAVRAARRLLRERFGIGYQGLADLWLDRLPPSASPRLRQRVAALAAAVARAAATRPDPSPADWASACRSLGLDPRRARRLLRRLTLRLGLRPLEPRVPDKAPPGAPAWPDILIDPDPREPAVSVLSPRIVVRPPETAHETATIAVLAPNVRETIRRSLLRIPMLRSRILGALARLGLDHNGPWLRGERRWRRPVPPRDVRRILPNPSNARRALHAWVSVRGGPPFPLYRLLGYDRPGDRIVHYPLDDIREIARREPGLSTARLAETLRAYGIHVPRTTLSRLLRAPSTGLPTKSGRPKGE